MSLDNERNRYSDEELEEFRVLIEGKLDEARKQLDQLQEQLTELNESGETSKAGTFEEGASNWQREHLNKLASRQQRFVRDLEYAMIRIKNKTYGICSVTGRLIDKKRLLLVPHATKSVEGKQELDDSSNKTKRPLMPTRLQEKAAGKKVISQVVSPKRKSSTEDNFDSIFDEDEDNDVLDLGEIGLDED